MYNNHFVQVCISATDSPLGIQTVHEKQQANKELLERKDENSEHYFKKRIGRFQIICYCKDSTNCKTKLRIALPQNMLEPNIKWFCIVTGHPGNKKL